MIYIDCDGVLSDFNKFCIEQTGYPYNDKVTWRVLENIDNLFMELDVMKGAEESVGNILDSQRYSGVQILTALPLITGKLTTAQVDKVTWVHDYIDDLVQVNCVNNWRNKKFFCQSNRDILIDDSQRNIDEWIAVGGCGILHSNWESTNAELKKIGVI